MFKFLERRERVINEESLDTALRAALGTSQVTEDTVMTIPAVASTVSFVAGAVASLPIRLYKRLEDGGAEEIRKDYRLSLLNLDTGDLLDAQQWKSSVVRDYILSGNGYTYVDWQGNYIGGLYYIEPSAVSVNVGADHIFKTADFMVDGRKIYDFQMMRILRNTSDGATGKGMVEESRLQLETMLNALAFENRMVRTGGKKGFLKAKGRLTQELINQLKTAWTRLYGSNSEENVVVLNDGVEFQDAGQTAVEAQLDENKRTNDHEVYKLSAIVPTLLEGKGSQEDRKNTIRFGVIPVVKALETAINRFCLLEDEKDDFYFEIDVDSLDGTDMLDRYQAYEAAVRTGWLQPEEVRREEGRNPLGMDFVLLGLDSVIYDPKTNMVYTPNTKEWADIKQKGGSTTE